MSLWKLLCPGVLPPSPPTPTAGTEMTSQAKSLHLPFTQSPALGSNSLRESYSNLWLSLLFPVRVMSSGGWDGGGAEAVCGLLVGSRRDKCPGSKILGGISFTNRLVELFELNAAPSMRRNLFCKTLSQVVKLIFLITLYL